MDEVPPALSRLHTDGRLPWSQVSATVRKLIQPLLDGRILEVSNVGRGEVLTLTREHEFRSWLAQNFPTFGGTIVIPDGAQRAAAIALRRDSKVTGKGVAHSILTLRAWGNDKCTIRVDKTPLQVSALSNAHRVASTVIGDTTVVDFGAASVMLVENLECFLSAEFLGTPANLALYSGGRVSERLISCLEHSDLGSPPLLHLPDYDPVGLDDYLRLKRQLGERVRLFVPQDLEQRFERFSAPELITKKKRNRELLERFMAQQPSPTDWPCAESVQVFELIRHHGAGLEQESLLIRSGLGST